MRENMIKNIRTHFFQQGILGLKVRIECASPDIGLIQYFLYRDVIEMLFFQKLIESLKNCKSCFLLSSIHVNPPYK